MFALILHGKLPASAVTGALEDTLTAAALAPVAYGSPRVHAKFLKEIAGVDFEGRFDLRFWPWFPLDGAEGAEPDAFGDGPGGALLIEAKAGSPRCRMAASVRRDLVSR